MKKTLFTFLFALLFCAQANAQSNDLALLYQSPPGTRPAAGLESAQGGMSGFSDRLDANGDGIPDLIMTREDEQGNLQDLLVIDVAFNDTLLIQGVHGTLGMSDIYPVSFFGFADPFGNGVRHAIFANEQDVRLFDTSDNSLEWSWAEANAGKQAATDVMRLLASFDITGDGYEELLIFLLQTKQVQVWSKP